MARQIQIRRGTAEEHESFTGAIGEVTMDTTYNTLRVHDGETVGGTILAKRSQIPDPETSDYVIEYHSASADTGYIWYRVYKSGRIEMGGHANISQQDHTKWGQKNITLPISLPNTSYSVMIGHGIPLNIAYATCVRALAQSTTAFRIDFINTASCAEDWFLWLNL